MISASQDEDDISVFFRGDAPRQLTARPGEGVDENLACLVVLVTSHLTAEVDTEVRQPAEVGVGMFLSELADLVALLLAGQAGQVLAPGPAHRVGYRGRQQGDQRGGEAALQQHGECGQAQQERHPGVLLRDLSSLE